MIKEGFQELIQKNLQLILMNLKEALGKSSKTKFCNLVAVSKTKPVEDIMTAYNFGHRQFGENYVEEFVEKSQHLPNDIQWCFIGHIQSNKVKKLVSVKNLYIVETVDSQKLAQKLDKELENLGPSYREKQLQVLIQVLTSDEGTKFGVSPDQVLKLVEFIMLSCPRLQFRGLMSMGKLHDIEGFKMMYDLKLKVAQEFKLNEEELILSMGTSADYDEAIMEGANEIRVGTQIFGERDYSKKQ